LVGADGKTHQGAFDLSFLRLVPNLTLMAPSDENELRIALATSIHHDGPVAFRFPRGSSMGLPVDPMPEAVAVGKARVLRKPPGKPDVLLVAAGPPAHAALAAAHALAEQGIEAAVVDARFVKPLDEETICGLAAQARRVVTVEENALAGGFGSACLEAFERAGLVERGIQVKRLGIPDAFITHGDAGKQRTEMGIDAAGIAAAARALVGDRQAAGRSSG
jgi:1-deoxy-D-xylulose-5-phosphate synthase